MHPAMAFMTGEEAEERRPSGRRCSVEKPNWHDWIPKGYSHGVENYYDTDVTTHLGDYSARVPTKVVTSCDKLRGDA